MRYASVLAVLVTTAACTTVPSAPDPLAFKGDAACPAQFDAAKEEVQWRKNVVDYGRIGGVLLAASGPAVALGGMVFDEQPATPPVETFATGIGLSAAGVLTVVLTGTVIPDLEAQAAVARRAYATPCPG
jgi:hypothetical protein